MHVISSRITTVIIQVVRTIKEMSHSQLQFHSIKKNNGEKLKFIMLIVLILKYNSNYTN